MIKCQNHVESLNLAQTKPAKYDNTLLVQPLHYIIRKSKNCN